MKCDTSCVRCEPWTRSPKHGKCWHKPPDEAKDATDGWVGVSTGKPCVFPKLYHTALDSGQLAIDTSAPVLTSDDTPTISEVLTEPTFDTSRDDPWYEDRNDARYGHDPLEPVRDDG